MIYQSEVSGRVGNSDQEVESDESIYEFYEDAFRFLSNFLNGGELSLDIALLFEFIL